MPLAQHLEMHAANLLSPAAALLQMGIVPEVLPELAKGAAAPFGLTSFALSTLLVLRCAPAAATCQPSLPLRSL